MMAESKSTEDIITNRQAVRLLFEALGFGGRESVFAQFPPELKAKIVSYLSRRNLQVLSGVSRVLRSIVVPHLWNPEKDPCVRTAKGIAAITQMHQLGALREALPREPGVGIYRSPFFSRAEREEAVGFLVANEVSTLTPTEISLLRRRLDRMIGRVRRTEASSYLWLCASRFALYVGMPMLIMGLMGDFGSASSAVAWTGGGLLAGGVCCFLGAYCQAERVAEAGVRVELDLAPSGGRDGYVAIP